MRALCRVLSCTLVHSRVLVVLMHLQVGDWSCHDRDGVASDDAATVSSTVGRHSCLRGGSGNRAYRAHPWRALGGESCAAFSIAVFARARLICLDDLRAQVLRNIGIALWCSEMALWLLCRVLAWRWAGFWSSPPLSAPASQAVAHSRGATVPTPFIFSPAGAVALTAHCAVGVALIAVYSNHNGDASDTSASNGAVGALGAFALLVAQAGFQRAAPAWPRYASMALLVAAIAVGASVKALASLVVVSCLLLVVVLAHIAVLCECWHGGAPRVSQQSASSAGAAADGDHDATWTNNAAAGVIGGGRTTTDEALPSGPRDTIV